MKIKTDPGSVWAEYMKSVDYKTAIDLYENVKKNENFYIGNQWEGVNAPDLPKPTLNILKRVVSYFVAMIVSDDVTAEFIPYTPSAELERACGILKTQCEQVIEEAKLKQKHREAIRNAAVDGDAALYLWFDPEMETGADAKGGIRAELVENTNVHFANPYSPDVQKQAYLILSMRRPVEEVKAEAKANGAGEDVISAITQSAETDLGETGDGEDLCTVLIKLWREQGKIYAQKSTEKAIVKQAWQTDYSLYPVAYFSWDRIRNSCHGASVITGLIPNQIAINKLFAMAVRSVEMNAFPKIIYDSTKIRRWSNRVGEAIAVCGSPAETVVNGMRGSDMSAQVMDVIDRAVNMTRDFMGASDAALGNVRPDNTSAIIAVQQAAAVPLELQKLNFYQFIEDYVRIMADMICAHFGKRPVTYTDNDGVVHTEEFDFSELSEFAFRTKVEVGATSYWSELMQVQTMDNLYAKGILTDAVKYVESMPSHYFKNKQLLLDALKEQPVIQEKGDES